MAPSSAFNLCYLRAALPYVSSGYPGSSVRVPTVHSPSGLKLSRPKSTPKFLNSYADLAPMNPLLSLGFSQDYSDLFHVVDNGGRVYAMKHGRKVPKLNRPPDHRRALLRGLTTQLLKYGRIKTTTARASAMRKYVDKMITLAKEGSLHKRRQALGFIYEKASPGLKSTNFVIRAVASVDYSDPTEKEGEKFGSKKYHFVVANAKFMLDEEEHFQELMGERLRNFGERNKEQDFWLVIEPKFLDKFPNIAKRLKRPAVALVSTNGPWITYMKLRLDRVLQESFETDSLEEALASDPVTIEFDKPEKWTAPYRKYELGWWVPFLPPQTVKV